MLMNDLTFPMDLLRLASSLAQEEKFPSAAIPALEDSISKLTSLETVEYAAVESGSER
jgi:hypothetical protein